MTDTRRAAAALAFMTLLSLPLDARADVIGMPFESDSVDECVRGGAGASCIERHGRAGRCRWFPSRRGYYCTPLTECERRDAGAECHAGRRGAAHCVPVADAGRGWPTLACVRDEQPLDAGATADANTDASATADARPGVVPSADGPHDALDPIAVDARAAPQRRESCACAAVGRGRGGRSAWWIAPVIAVLSKRRHKNKRSLDHRAKS